jgi:hypothetical protein
MEIPIKMELLAKKSMRRKRWGVNAWSLVMVRVLERWGEIF